MMSRDACLSMLNRAHAFPGPYVFKIIGDNTLELVARSLQVVVWVLGRTATPEVALRHSSGGRHLSVSLRVRIPEAERILDIYRGLGSVGGVRFLI